MLFQRRSQKVEVLRSVPLFQNFSQRDLDRVAKIADEVDSQPGEVLLRQGEPGRELFLIVQGKVRIERNGKVITHLGAGEVLGEIALLDGKRRTATAITDAPSTLLVVHWSQFWSLVEGVPGLERKLLVGLAERFRERLESID
jgi:CRP-like cAMP-binding protein